MRIFTEGKIEVERRIAARPETVFSYFTDPERFVRWQGVDAELDPRPGGLFRVTVSGKSHLAVRGEYVEVNPPTRLVFTWGWEPSDGLPKGLFGLNPGTSTVEVDLVPDGQDTILRLRHSGLPTDANRKAHTDAWAVTLKRLGICATGGDPGPNPFEDL
ncbi:MAG TPA: SRPBCC domain-containing protein [Actinomycetota bacterium]|nr:SRPBCC domain-containing protein [Actinomycetota bacterium]